MASMRAQNKHPPLKLDRKTLIPAPKNPVRQSMTPRYLHLKKASTVKPTRAQPNLPLNKEKGPSVVPEVLKNGSLKTKLLKLPEDQGKVIVEKSTGIKSITQKIEVAEQIISPGKVLPSKRTEQSEKASPHTYPKEYNPHQFTLGAHHVKKPMENKKLVVEEIQKNIKKWRIQRESKFNENKTQRSQNSDGNTESLCTEVSKFVPEKKKCVDVGTNMSCEHLANENLHIDQKKINNKFYNECTNASKIICGNVNEIKCIDGITSINDMKTLESNTSDKTKHNISVQVSLNEYERLNKSTNHLVENKQNEDSRNGNQLCTENNTTVEEIHKPDEQMRPMEHVEIHEFSMKPKPPVPNKGNSSSDMPNVDKKNRTRNQVFTTHHNDFDTITNGKVQTGDSPELTIEKQRKSIYALVDRYLNKTRSNPNQSMENLLKCMLFNLEGSNKYVPLLDINFQGQFDSFQELKEDEKSGSKEVTHNTDTRDISSCSRPKHKEKYSKKIKTHKFKSKFLEHAPSPQKEDSSNIIIANNSDILIDKPVLSKDEKFKTLTLIGSKQSEKMCIHINYQPHSSPVKSKLTIHKESHINIRPLLTKHTFTTATCKPQVYSSRPNISTQYLVHLEQGGCEEIKHETEQIAEKKNISHSVGIVSHKMSRLDHVIRTLIRHVKLNMHFNNKMTSAVAEKLFALQEFLCNYYRNQNALSFNSLSANSRQLITLIILEIDNPHPPNLDVKTNQNLRLILEHLIENLHSKNKKNANGPPPPPPPPPVVNFARGPELSHSQKTVIPTCPKHCTKKLNFNKENCTKPHTSKLEMTCLPTLPSSKMSYYHQARRKFRGSFGMKKNYLSKKLRLSLDNKALNVNGKKTSTLKSVCENSNAQKATEEPVIQAEVKAKSPDLSSQSDGKDNSEEVIYESDWLTPSSSSTDQRTTSNPMPSSQNQPEKTVQIIETTNHAEIQIRLREPYKENNEERYRISVRTEEDSVIRGVRPELPCILLNDENRFIRNKNKLMNEIENNSSCCNVDKTKTNEQENETPTLHCKNLASSMYNKVGNILGDKKTIVDIQNNKGVTKSRNNFTSIEKSYADNVLLDLSKPDFIGNAPKKQFSYDSSYACRNQNSCGDNENVNSTEMVGSKVDDKKEWSLETKQNPLLVLNMGYSSPTERNGVNIGVNTDASLLQSLLKSWHQSETDSYACDLSMCFSTTDNELSEGEIGMFAFRSQSSCYSPSSISKSPVHYSKYSNHSLRNDRMLKIQQLAEYFLAE